MGTGDVVDECHRQLEVDDSPLTGTHKHSHNQYLSFLVAFGLTGTLLILGTFVWAIFKGRHHKVAFFVAYLVILLISFLSEDTLETLAGVVFASYFMCLTASHQELFKSLNDNDVSIS